jgi:hypothetical protein
MDQAEIELLAALLAGELDLPTLRDRFAMAALPALMFDTEGGGGAAPYAQQPMHVVAQDAYALADAMLEARKRKAGTSG